MWSDYGKNLNLQKFDGLIFYVISSNNIHCASQLEIKWDLKSKLDIEDILAYNYFYEIEKGNGMPSDKIRGYFDVGFWLFQEIPVWEPNEDPNATLTGTVVAESSIEEIEIVNFEVIEK